MLREKAAGRQHRVGSMWSVAHSCSTSHSAYDLAICQTNRPDHIWYKQYWGYLSEHGIESLVSRSNPVNHWMEISRHFTDNQTNYSKPQQYWSQFMCCQITVWLEPCHDCIQQYLLHTHTHYIYIHLYIAYSMSHVCSKPVTWPAKEIWYNLYIKETISGAIIYPKAISEHWFFCRPNAVHGNYSFI